MEGAGPELTFPLEYHLTARFCCDMSCDLKISYISEKKAHLESLIYVLFKLSCCVKGPALLLKIT